MQLLIRPHQRQRDPAAAACPLAYFPFFTATAYRRGGGRHLTSLTVRDAPLFARDVYCNSGKLSCNAFRSAPFFRAGSLGRSLSQAGP